jgi:glycosyltransferase involved in cell wall biosynthesis
MFIPSHKEGFWLVALEANMYGIPVIAYDVWWLRDAVIPGKNGILIPEWDIQSLANTAIELLKNNEEKLVSLSQSAYEHVKHIHSWSDNAKEFEKILEKYR